MAQILIQQLPYTGDSQALFSRLRHLPGSFYLHSASGFADASFEVMSALPIASEQLEWQAETPRHRLLQAVDRMTATLTRNACRETYPHPLPGWYGLASYDLYGALNNLPLGPQDLQLDLLNAGFYPAILLLDHASKQLALISLEGYEAQAQQLMDALHNPAPTPQQFQLAGAFQSNMSQAEYLQRFDQVQHYLQAGDCYQVNLAQRFSAPFSGDPWQAFLRLTTSLPAPMASFFSSENHCCLSLSPERFLSISQGRIRTHPIKGTRPRDADPALDLANATALQRSDKDRAENLMIVDLLRNDLGRSCMPGSIRVTRLFAVESFANVHHLVSTVEGELRPDVHPLQAFFSAFPGGSITGAPKRRAIEIIAGLEPHNRSFYCGSAFYCDVGGRLDSSILIRSLVTHQNRIYCWGGGGIVADSVGSQEFQETLDKVGLILKTLESNVKAIPHQ